MQNFRKMRQGVSVRAVLGVCLASVALACACSDSTDDSGTPAAPDGGDSVGGAADSAGGAGGAGGADEAPKMLTETALQLSLSLSIPDAVAGGGAGGEGGAGPEPQPTTLEVIAKDGATPVVTDLWLYTLDDDGNATPLTDFKSTAERKSRALMLPAKIDGKNSGLSPADDGVLNGTMTATSRGKLVDGAFVSTVNGKVTISFATTPTQPILVVAGVEDQRYAGAAAINLDGSAADVPDGFGKLETHVQRSYAKDIAPMVQLQCQTVCHNPNGPNGAAMYLMDSLDHLLNDNFALTEGASDCEADNAVGTPEYDACVQAIAKAEFLVEPGAPALTDLLTRSIPDASDGTSPAGLLWYGGGTPKSRFNAEYGDRRMPSTSISLDPADWQDLPTYFDQKPEDFQILYDWVAQGAKP